MNEFDLIKQHSEYASVNNAEYIPEICNEFVTLYLEEP